MQQWITVTAGIIVSAALIFLLALGPPTGVDVEHFRELLLSYGPWAAVVSAVLMVAQAVIAPLPANVITITNGVVFGPFWGGLLSWTTTLLGSSLCFALSRTLGKPFAIRLAGGSIQSAERMFKKYGLQAVFVARIVPLVPFDAISYGAGLVGVPYSRFLVATAVGCIPGVVTYSYIGSIFAGFYWWVMITLLTISLVGIILASRLLRRAFARQASLGKTVTTPVS
jgi:uncharacterized membrane protein YdjX (TVP38/TMEM64 family)